MALHSGKCIELRPGLSLSQLCPFWRQGLGGSSPELGSVSILRGSISGIVVSIAAFHSEGSGWIPRPLLFGLSVLPALCELGIKGEWPRLAATEDSLTMVGRPNSQGGPRV